MRTVTPHSWKQASMVFLLLTIAGSVAANPPRCEVSRGEQRNDVLKAYVPREGFFVFRPGGPGFVDRDGALGMKFAWSRLVPGTIQAGGRRLDGEAPPARAYFNKGYGNQGFHPSYLVFPTPGCWEITGRLAGKSLTFVVWVEKIDEGPSWKYEQPDDPFWYVTQL